MLWKFDDLLNIQYVKMTPAVAGVIFYAVVFFTQITNVLLFNIVYTNVIL